jgi:hypothetical protein
VGGSWDSQNTAAYLYTDFAGLSSLYVGAAGYWTGSAAGGGTTRIISLQEGGTTHVAVVRKSDSTLDLINGNGTVLGNTGFALNLSVWNHFIIDATISDTVGSAALWLNGAKIIDVSGVDTRNGGTSGVISRLRFDAVSLYYYAGSVGIDDVYIGDHTGPAPYNAPLGDCLIMPLRPDSNGDLNEWIGSDGNSVDNYNLVKDVATTTDYVSSSVTGARDLYGLTNLDAAPTGIAYTPLAVQQEALVAKADNGVPADLKGVYRSGTTDVES